MDTMLICHAEKSTEVHLLNDHTTAMQAAQALLHSLCRKTYAFCLRQSLQADRLGTHKTCGHAARLSGHSA